MGKVLSRGGLCLKKIKYTLEKSGKAGEFLEGDITGYPVFS